MRIKDDDEENTAFGFPIENVDQKPGFDGEVTKETTKIGINRRLRPSEKKDIPQESLAARISKTRKKG